MPDIKTVRAAKQSSEMIHYYHSMSMLHRSHGGYY